MGSACRRATRNRSGKLSLLFSPGVSLASHQRKSYWKGYPIRRTFRTPEPFLVGSEAFGNDNLSEKSSREFVYSSSFIGGEPLGIVSSFC